MAITTSNLIKITYGTKSGLSAYKPSVGEIIFLTDNVEDNGRKVLEIAVCTSAPESGTPTYEYITDETLLAKFNELNSKIYIDESDKVHIATELDLHEKKITNLLEGEAETDAATVGQVTEVSTRVAALEDGTAENVPYVKKTGDTMTGPLAMSNQKITGLGTGTNDSDAVNVKQLNDKVAAIGTVMNFLGAVYTKPVSNSVTLTDGTEITADKGDVIVVSTVAADSTSNKDGNAGKEFVWSGTAWIEIGNEGVAADLEALKTSLDGGAYMPKWNTF